MSGFVSSLGGSFMQANAGNMSLGAKVTMSAVIGGTAEKLGGGKPACRRGHAGRFANGAVTGAYVMMFNHLGNHSGGEKKSFRVTAEFKKLALALRFNPYGNNPFFMAEAIFFDGGFGLAGSEYDGGFFLVLAGEDAGALIPYTELAGGAAPEASVGVEIGRVDLADKSIPFKTEMLFGERTKTWGGAVFVGGAVSYSKTPTGVQLISTSVNIGFSVNPFGGFSVGGNRGNIKPYR